MGCYLRSFQRSSDATFSVGLIREMTLTYPTKERCCPDCARLCLLFELCRNFQSVFSRRFVFKFVMAFKKFFFYPKISDSVESECLESKLLDKF